MNNQVLENPVKNQTLKVGGFSPLVVVTALLVTAYLTANIMAVKLISVAGVTLFDAGTLIFPLAYMLGDVLTEIWGFKTARKVIFLTFFCNLILVGFTTLGLFVPTPDYMAETDAAYAAIFTAVPRILIASFIAFLTGELSNAYLMERIKMKTGERLLAVRTIGSSIVGHLLDTGLFVIIAFAGTAPVADLVSMVVVQYFVKLGIEALAGTPLAYAIINYLKKKEAAV